MTEKINNNRDRAKKLFMFVLQLSLGIGLIYFLFNGKFHLILEKLADFNFIWLVPAMLLYYSHMIVGAWRWYMLAKILNFKLTLWEAISLSMKSYFCSLVIPGGAIGGDIAKIGFLSTRAAKGTKVEGAFTVLMDRIIGMIALFVLAIILTLISIPLIMSINAPELYVMCGIADKPEMIYQGKCLVIVGILLLCITGLTACFIMFMHQQLEKLFLVRWMISLVNRISHGSFARMTTAIDLYRGQPGLIFKMTIVSVFFVHINLVIVVFCLLKGLGASITQPLALFTGVILGNIAGLIPFTPSGIGFRDYTIVKFMESCGASLSQANATALLFTSLIIFSNISCGIFFLIGKSKKDKGI